MPAGIPISVPSCHAIPALAPARIPPDACLLSVRRTAGNLSALSEAVYEYVGLLTYWLLGLSEWNAGHPEPVDPRLPPRKEEYLDGDPNPDRRTANGAGRWIQC
jgi:hypothetical protein